MVSEIQHQLDELERQHSVKILYACESGSRAWGFPSTDSDYDVRFIYAQPRDKYLSIDEFRDVLDLPVNEVLDINGWDIRKALRLFRTSNPPLYEWLQSPIVYRQSSVFMNDIRQLMADYFSPRAGLHHYSSMARNAFSELQSEEVRLKKYFYCLRSLLAALWIVEKNEVPPMTFGALRTLISEPALQELIDLLLEQKEHADEKSTIKSIPRVQHFIQEQIAYCETKGRDIPKKETESSALNDLFRKHLYEI
ncbi:nucleotidyltransferase domain-containing protein [Polluticoccus soli]|uniref:nucleotidyltransferase domain-containing protein n=1 Tax=Polluticoccus soli TaxID=3034150 RepID=UPI0023E12494|nr:nucleotidyltransferase domain-containing protein [Flavipsychrobacter sp. JY13-12]